MSPRFIYFTRWVALLVGSGLFVLIVVLMITGAYPNPFTLHLRDQMLSFFLFMIFGGILLAWKWEGFGGALLIIGYAGMRAILSFGKPFTIFTFIDVFLLLGLMHLGVWWSGRRTLLGRSSPSETA